MLDVEYTTVHNFGLFSPMSFPIAAKAYITLAFLSAAKQGDNRIISVRLSIRLSVHLFV